MLFDPEPTPSYEDSHTKAALKDLVRWGFIEKEYRRGPDGRLEDCYRMTERGRQIWERRKRAWEAHFEFEVKHK